MTILNNRCPITVFIPQFSVFENPSDDQQSADHRFNWGRPMKRLGGLSLASSDIVLRLEFGFAKIWRIQELGQSVCRKR